MSSEAKSDENLALTIGADPQLQKHFVDRISEATFQIPTVYDREIRGILETQVSLIPNIDSPEDYKVLVQAIGVLKACKERLAVIRHHLKGLAYRWRNLHKQASKYLETKYYTQLGSVRDSTRKSILISALEPISSGVEELEHLLDVADMAHFHLNDINWAIRNSTDLITNYFNTIKVMSPKVL